MKCNKALLVFGVILFLFLALSNAFAFGANPFSYTKSSSGKYSISIEPYKKKASFSVDTSGIYSGTAVGYVGKKAVAGFVSIFEGFGTFFDTTVEKIEGNNSYAAYRAEISDISDWIEDFTDEYKPKAVASFIGNAFEGIGQSSVYIPCAFVLLCGAGLSFSRKAAKANSDHQTNPAEQEKQDKRLNRFWGILSCFILLILAILIISDIMR